MIGNSVWAWDEPAQVEGVYQIGTASELEWFAEYVNSASSENTAMLNAKAVLTADIDLQGVNHTPIGASATYKYDGTFDGQHHVISNMIINLPNQENVGFFGLVRGNATIKNIIIDSSCSVTGKNRVAGLIGCVQTLADKKLTILNCVNMATVHATAGVASGIIGAGQSKYPVFKMHNCVNIGSISTDATNNWTVAFDGWNKYDSDGTAVNSQVWNCYNAGEMNRIEDGNNIFRGTHRSVLNTYDLKYKNSNMQSQSNIPNDVKTSADGFKTADPLHSGELCYYLNHGIEMMNRTDVSLGEEFTQDLSDPNSIPMPNASGMKIYQVAALDCAGNPKGGVSYSNVEGGSTRDDHDFDPATGLCKVCSAPKEDWMSAEEDGYYHLSTPAQVEWFSQMVRLGHHGGMDVMLDNDIDFGGVPNAHFPIGTSAHKYWGHFDGQGHRIIGMVLNNNLVQDNPGYDGMGFFGSVRGGGTDDVWNVTKNNPIIENLIIDKSCSIAHTQNFAAGVVAHINTTNSGVTITIRNCGNEANVTTTGKNAAGILGCVEATNVGLKLYNLWNKGNITGNGGESAAICAWTGQRNVDGEVDVKGCWNIGEVTGVDGNGYNLIRRNTNIVLRNVVDLCATNAGNQGRVTVNTTNPIESGELCFFLNGDQSKIVYTQTLGEDVMPVYGTTSSQVYRSGTINCVSAAVGDLDFNNVGGETIVLGHDYSDGICNVCNDFQEPQKDGDYYLLANAGNVEWFSNAVKNGGGGAFYAKLTNDIDFLCRENLHSPIGPSVGSKFKGVFDGQGYRIRNLIINRPSDNNIGFFGFLQGNATTQVMNLIIDSSCTIHANNRVGGLTGSYQNPNGTITIENVVNEATVIAEHQDAGGFIGGHEGGDPTIIIRNCVNAGNITAKNAAPYAGALCCYLGVSGASKIENFLNIGTVNGHNGGNIGRHNIADVTNLIDLSATDNKTQGIDSGLTQEDLANGKVAYTMGFKQLIGSSEYPSPFGSKQVLYVGAAGYTTLYDADNDWELNGDAQAYIGTLNGSYLHLTDIDDIPASTAVIISGTYYNMVSTTASASTAGNNLLGSDGTVTGGDGIYALANKSNGIGFYPVGNSVTIPAGKAYLNSKAGVKAFLFNEEDTTSLNEELRVKNEKSAGAVYDLSGRRISSQFSVLNSQLKKGVYIQGDKKVLF